MALSQGSAPEIWDAAGSELLLVSFSTAVFLQTSMPRAQQKLSIADDLLSLYPNCAGAGLNRQTSSARWGPEEGAGRKTMVLA